MLSLHQDITQSTNKHIVTRTYRHTTVYADTHSSTCSCFVNVLDNGWVKLLFHKPDKVTCTYVDDHKIFWIQMLLWLIFPSGEHYPLTHTFKKLKWLWIQFDHVWNLPDLTMSSSCLQAETHLMRENFKLFLCTMSGSGQLMEDVLGLKNSLLAIKNNNKIQ